MGEEPRDRARLKGQARSRLIGGALAAVLALGALTGAAIAPVDGGVQAIAGVAAAGSSAAPEAATAAGAATASVTEGLDYVALGDSFAAGLGLPDETGKPVSGCAQSAKNYPHLVARALRLTLTDVTCTGAETVNVISNPQKTGNGTAPVQRDSLSAATRVVTITIGGNDLGFFTTTASCVALSANGPLLASAEENCRQKYVKAGMDTLAERIAGPVISGRAATAKDPTPVARGLTATFAAITAAAPNARVFVVGYPAIMPPQAETPQGGCFRAQIEGASLDSLRIENGFPFTDVDVQYLYSIEEALDAAMERAATQAGFTYIPVLPGSSAHSGCAVPKQSYINGISLRATKKFSVALSGGALHPNAAGSAFMAKLVTVQIAKAFTATTDSPPATPSSAPRWWIIAAAALAAMLAAAATTAVWLKVRRRSARVEPRDPRSAGG